MTEPTVIDTNAHIQLSPLGHVVVAMLDDGTRVVQHADPTIRVFADWAEPDVENRDWFDSNGHLRLDTAGEFLYRPTGTMDGDWRLYVRIGGPDDPQAPGYDPHP